MHTYSLGTKQVPCGPCDVIRDGKSLKIITKNNKEIVLENDGFFDRFFDVIPKLLGLIRKGDDGYFLAVAPYAMLHNHGECSLLDGLSTPKKIAKKLLRDDEVNTPFFALTDHGLPSGLPAFDKELKKNNLYPINGIEVYTDSMDGTKKNRHLVLLAKNETGFKNISKLCTEAQTNFYRHANVTMESLRAHSEGLVCLSACLAGELPQQVLAGNLQEARECIETFREIFGQDFYVEIQNHGIEDENKVRDTLVSLAREYGVGIVGTTDSHYVNKEDAYAHEVLLAIGTKKLMTDEDRFRFDGSGYHILNADEFYKVFRDYPDAISGAFEIVKKCQFTFVQKEIEMPYFEIPDGYTEEAYFDKLVEDGFAARFAGTPELTSPEYAERLRYELSVIHEMGFEGYLLIVQDFINWAKKQDIAVGPGRGSAVGSLICYCLGITDLDPIPYHLLFERE